MASLNAPVDLVALTGSVLDEAGVLRPILDQAYRVMMGYLAPYGLTPSGGLCAAAELKLGQAELLTRMRMDGSKPDTLSLGGLTRTDDNDEAINGLRKAAFELLDYYVQSQHTLANSHRVYVRRVNR